MTNNIVDFPKMSIMDAPSSPEEVKAKLLEYKTSYSDEIAQILWENVLCELTRSGCDFNKDIDKYFPSMVLVFESIRSLHLLSSGVEHPLQEFAKQTITAEEMVDIETDL